MCYVYILKLKNAQLYVGRTDNLRRRIKEHVDGKVKATKNKSPLKLIFYEAFMSKKDATRRERYFKTSKGKSTIKMMLQDFLNFNFNKIE